MEARAVLDRSTIHYLSSRRAADAGVILAPSTSVGSELGFLIVGCTFTADAGTAPGSVRLGRSWDTSHTKPTPNGQAVIRDSALGGHIRSGEPWGAAATTHRPYSPSGNRLYEHCNTGPGR